MYSIGICIGIDKFIGNGIDTYIVRATKLLQRLNLVERFSKRAVLSYSVLRQRSQRNLLCLVCM